jgi:RND family efflux transporter MFP subunit
MSVWTECRWAAPATLLLLHCFALKAQTRSPSAQAAATAPDRAAVNIQTRPVTESFQAYGQVQPIAPLPVSAIEAGVVTEMKVVPGSEVTAGEALATLSGPEIQSLLTNREGAVRSAQTQLAAAQRNLAIERRQLSSQMSTQQAIATAQSAVAAAQAAFDSAQAQLRVAQDVRTLRAPSAGRVLAVNAAQGERVAAGQTVLTLQTGDRLWLAAVYYGADVAAIRTGMTGQFDPAAGGAAVPVKVVAVAAALAADGGESVGLVAMDQPAASQHAAPAPWLNGERGTVTLNGRTQSLVAVPTRALILDQAHWWVLLRTPKGVRAQAVVPGPTRGWDTFIEQGLSPGEQVVVQNAYREYHRGIAQRYTPPD